MSADGKPDDLSSLAGRVAAAKRAAKRRHYGPELIDGWLVDDQDKAAADDPAQTDGHKYLKVVRVIIFFLVALLAVTFGHRFRSYSSSGDINFTPPSSSVFFDVYVSNPSITINFDLSVDSTDNEGTVNLTANAPVTVQSGTIILVSTVRGDQYSGVKRFLLDDHEGVTPSRIYVVQISFRRPPQLSKGEVSQEWLAYGGGVTFTLPNPMFRTKDRLFVQMPAIEEDTWPGPLFASLPVPQLFSEKDPQTGKLIGFTADHNPIKPIDPTNAASINELGKASDWRIPHGVLDTAFWVPQITSTEEISGLDQVLRNDQINSSVPAGIIKQDSYSWQNNGTLSAYLTATDPNAVSVESTWDFYSGIAFGIAVGAGVAFVQELPDAIRLPRRWRAALRATREFVRKRLWYRDRYGQSTLATWAVIALMALVVFALIVIANLIGSLIY